MNIFTKCSLLSGLLLIASSCSRESDVPRVPMALNRPSDELKATVVVPTMEAPIPNGKNAIWCASFQSVWKDLQGLVGEAVTFDSPSGVAASLNNVADPRPHIPASSLYVVAGTNSEATINQIATDLKQRFPNKQPPIFHGITPDSLIAYAYLEANVQFLLPYDQNRRPLVFTEGEGKKVEINSFSLTDENHNGRDKLWDQPYVLFRKGEAREDSLEFAIDLCSNSYPSQIVVARIAREATLADALARVDREVAEAQKLTGLEAMRLHKVQTMDMLVVPDFHWAISHHYVELEGKVFKNNRIKGRRFDIVQQDMLFRLDRSGASLKSEVKAYAAGEPTPFILDRPFLVYMKKRGAEMPYFAMWIDNAELMNLWQGGGVTARNEPSK